MNCITHPFCASFFAWLARAQARARSELDRFSLKAQLFREIDGSLLQRNSVTPLFYSICLRKIRLYMIHPNLKNFHPIFRLIHYNYNLILGVSLEACRHSICLLFHSFHFTAILMRFTVTLVRYHKDNAYISLLVIAVKVMGVSVRIFNALWLTKIIFIMLIVIILMN